MKPLNSLIQKGIPAQNGGAIEELRTRQMELTAWALTALWLGSYYRTYPTPVQDEVSAALASPTDFIAGPMTITRDAPSKLGVGFTVRDGHYLSARWPGDAHRFANEFAAMLAMAVE